MLLFLPRAISQSGPLLDMPALHFSQDPWVYGQQFVEAVGCKEQTLECLQNKPLVDLMEKSKMFERFTFMPNPWKPVVEKMNEEESVFLGEEPLESIAKGQFNQVKKKGLDTVRLPLNSSVFLHTRFP